MLVRVGIAVPPPLRRRLQKLLPEDEAVVTTAGAKELALVHAAREGVDLLITDAERLGTNPADFLGSVRALPERPETIVVWHQEDPQFRARLIAAGALAVVYSGLTDAEIGQSLRSLLQRHRELLQQRLPAEADPGARASLDDFVAESPAIRDFLRLARRVRQSDTTLLILGETGTGKERLARAMHAEGPRARGPFVAVSCGALVEGLLESELFGHVEGAFTGASHARRGMFEVAHSGSLFLDEIGELPLALQPKLLRVLQERTIQPVGSERTIRVDVRLIAATNRDLQAEVAAGRFRADLFYRLNVVTLTIPPLRARREDVPGIVQSQVSNLCARLARPVPAITPEALEALTSHHWPGNVRELINVVERAILIGEDGAIGLDDLPPTVSGRTERAGSGLAPAAALYGRPLAEATATLRAEFERSYLDRLLRQHAGRVGACAGAAGLSTRALYTKMRVLGLRKEDYRAVPRRRPGRAT
jgi:DNA-binding NtrC family response regulator